MLVSVDSAGNCKKITLEEALSGMEGDIDRIRYIYETRELIVYKADGATKKFLNVELLSSDQGDGIVLKMN